MEDRTRNPLLLMLAGGLIIMLAVGGESGPDDLKLYRGLLHAHTLISDGAGTPDEAYTMARETGLDFFAVTPHNHKDAERGAKDRTDGVTIALLPELYNGSADVEVNRVWKENGTEHRENIVLRPLIATAEAHSTADFLALYGQEFSSISSGNHMNVFGADRVITVPNGDVSALLDFIRQQDGDVIVQLNHPDVHADLFYGGNSRSTRNKMFNDYGIDSGDLGPHFRDLVAQLDPHVQLIEILSGPAMKRKPIPSYRYSAEESDYFFYLRQGFHLAPSAGQDNHYKTWGRTTPARMGIYSKSLSNAHLFEACRAYRTFASEDNDLAVRYFLNGNFMGSIIELDAQTELTFAIEITDSSEPQAEYTVGIYGAEVVTEHSRQATKVAIADGLLFETEHTGNGTVNLSSIFSSGKPQFFFVKIEQEDGNRLWTAPIWVNHPEQASTAQGPLFFWTRSSGSKVYHIKGCPTIDRIAESNLESGTEPPPGRRAHECPVSPADEVH